MTVIAIEKGHTAKERVQRGFGAPQPEGYRKALRLMRQAEKFHRPVVCFVDTSGAGCDVGAEERGQGEAIAECLTTMSALQTPVLSILIGEGGSGGALALAAGDRVWMLENAVYSVISPEGCATILWKDAAKAEQAAEEPEADGGRRAALRRGRIGHPRGGDSASRNFMTALCPAPDARDRRAAGIADPQVLLPRATRASAASARGGTAMNEILPLSPSRAVLRDRPDGHRPSFQLYPLV